MFFPVYSVFLRNKPERSSSLMNSLTQSNINKNKRNVEVDDSKEFGMKLLKLLKKSVISVNPDDPSTDDYNRPKKISSPHTKDEDEPTIAHSNNTISATNSSPTPSEYLSDPDAQQIQEEEATLQKIIVVLCSLGASLILVTIAIGILFWKVQKQHEPDDRPNIDVTVSINNENDDNDNLNGTAYNKSTSFKTEFPHVIEESSLDTKKLEMSRSAVPSYPSYPSNQSLSILPSAPTVEELELHDASASNFSTDPPAYS
ncbi:9606_t:CDS:2, partial [Gigaspora rosea]